MHSSEIGNELIKQTLIHWENLEGIDAPKYFINVFEKHF